MRAGTRVVGVVTGMFLLIIGIAEARPPACGNGTVWRLDDTSGASKAIWVQQPEGPYLLSARPESSQSHCDDGGTRDQHPGRKSHVPAV